MFTIGEVFNGDPNYCSGYQGPLSAVLDYPMYYKLYNAFQEKQTMKNIHDGVNAVRLYLGTFLIAMYFVL